MLLKLMNKTHRTPKLDQGPSHFSDYVFVYLKKKIEREKGAQSKPNPSLNAFPKLCEWFSG